MRRRSAAPAGALVRQGLLAALDGDVDRVEALLSEIVRVDSRDVDAYLGLARVHRTRGDWARATAIDQTLVLRRDLDAAQRIDALAGLGADLRGSGELDRSIASYEEVLAHDRQHTGALRALEEILPLRGQYGRALVMLRRRARSEGRRDRAAEARLLAALARSARDDSRAETARRAAKRALRRDAQCVDALIVAGDLEADRGRQDRALKLWLRVPEADPARAAAVYPRLASAHRKQGSGETWLAWLRTRVEAVPADAAARVALGRALAESGDTHSAVAEVRRLRRGNDEDLASLVALGRVLVEAPHERVGVDAVKAYGELLDVLEARITEEAGGDRESGEGES